jgi:hypothetical protein
MPHSWKILNDREEIRIVLLIVVIPCDIVGKAKGANVCRQNIS